MSSPDPAPLQVQDVQYRDAKYVSYFYQPGSDYKICRVGGLAQSWPPPWALGVY